MSQPDSPARPEEPMTEQKFEKLLRDLLDEFGSSVATDALSMPFEQSKPRRTGHANSVVAIMRQEWRALRTALATKEKETEQLRDINDDLVSNRDALRSRVRSFESGHKGAMLGFGEYVFRRMMETSEQGTAVGISVLFDDPVFMATRTELAAASPSGAETGK